MGVTILPHTFFIDWISCSGTILPRRLNFPNSAFTELHKV